MILRRLVAHLREQHWMGVFIELVIVVLGVFVGLQVSNWNEARNKADQEAMLRIRLADDMKALEGKFALTCKDFDVELASMRGLLDALRSGVRPADEKTFRAYLWGVGTVNDPPSLSVTYRELTTGAGLALLSDPRLRAELVRYGDVHERLLRESILAKEVVLDPRSVYFHAVRWSSNAADWQDPETAIVSYDWDALVPATAELQSWEAYQFGTVSKCRKTEQSIARIVSLLRDGNAPGAAP